MVPQLVISQHDDGKVFPVSVNVPLEVRLPGNPTTGYVWLHEMSENEEKKLRVEEQRFRSDAHHRGVMGSGGTFTFRVTPLLPGTYPVEFTYRRTWEKSPPAKTFKVTLEVRA